MEKDQKEEKKKKEVVPYNGKLNDLSTQRDPKTLPGYILSFGSFLHHDVEFPGNLPLGPARFPKLKQLGLFSC